MNANDMKIGAHVRVAAGAFCPWNGLVGHIDRPHPYSPGVWVVDLAGGLGHIGFRPEELEAIYTEPLHAVAYGIPERIRTCESREHALACLANWPATRGPAYYVERVGDQWRPPLTAPGPDYTIVYAPDPYAKDAGGGR